MKHLILVVFSLFCLSFQVNLRAQTQTPIGPCDIALELAKKNVFNTDWSKNNAAQQEEFIYTLSTLDYGKAKELIKKELQGSMKVDTLTQYGMIGGEGDWEAKFTEDRFNTWKREYSQKIQSRSGKTLSGETLKSYADPSLINGIVKSVEICAITFNSKSQSLVSIGVEKSTEDYVTLKVVYFMPPGDPVKAVISDDIRLPEGIINMNATDDRKYFLFKSGDEILNGQRLITLNRKNNKKQFDISINTNHGGTFTSISSGEVPLCTPSKTMVIDAFRDYPPGDRNSKGLYGGFYEPGTTTFVNFKGERVFSEGINVWYTENFASGGTTLKDNKQFGVPYIMANESGKDLTTSSATIAAHMLTMHPGPNDAKAVLRWNVTESGTYLIEGVVKGLDNGPTTVSFTIRYNEKVIKHEEEIGDFMVNHPLPPIIINGVRNEPVDFIIGYGKNRSHDHDSTGLNFQISRLVQCSSSPNIK